MSHGGIKVFLLICGLKLWLKEPGPIADVLFHILIDKNTKIQDRRPTSASEISELVDVLLAYSPQLTKGLIECLEQIRSGIQAACDPSDFPKKIFDVPTAQYTAELLVKVFQAFRNEEFCRISLEGSVSAMWIGSLLAWLLPEHVAFTFKEFLILGRPEARIAIELEEHGKETGTWKIQT